jgi:hypothetical protein
MKKAQGPITVIFYVITFALLFALVFSSWLSYWGNQAVEANHLTGIEALIFSNLNIIVFICLVIVALAAGAMIGGGE